MHTKKKGNLSEIKTITKFIELGAPVLLPFGDNDRYDIAVELGGDLKRVQIKTARLDDDGVLSCNLYSVLYGGKKNQSYTKDEVDLIIAYSPELDECYYIDDFENKKSISFRTQLTKRGKKGKNWAEDYILENKFQEFWET